jgi:hypothetical protein
MVVPEDVDDQWNQHGDRDFRGQSDVNGGGAAVH